METNGPPLPAAAQIQEVEGDSTEFTIRCDVKNILSVQIALDGEFSSA